MEPHSLPSGRVAQLPMRVGFGFGSPSPVTGFTAAVAIAAGGVDSAAHPARIVAPMSTDIRRRNEDMVPLHANLDLAAARPRAPDSEHWRSARGAQTIQTDGPPSFGSDWAQGRSLGLSASI